MRRGRESREHLGRADVRSAEHADFAVRVGKRRRPFDRIVAIEALVFEWIEITIRCVAPARVLDDHHISASRRAISEIRRAGLVVRRALEQYWKFSVGFGAIDVGAQRDAVARLHYDAALNVYLRGQYR